MSKLLFSQARLSGIAGCFAFESVGAGLRPARCNAQLNFLVPRGDNQ
jgi:hypothetical protein